MYAVFTLNFIYILKYMFLRPYLFSCFVCVDCYNWFNMDNCFHNCYHDPSLGLTYVCVEEQMSLLPMHLGNISGGVKQKLNSFIGSYSEK